MLCNVKCKFKYICIIISVYIMLYCMLLKFMLLPKNSELYVTKYV